MARNRLGTRRALRFSPSSGHLLPWVGPFQVLTRPSSSSLPNITISSDTTIFPGDAGSSDDNPLKANVLTISAGKNLFSGTRGVFIWCDTLTMETGSNIICRGSDGNDGFLGCCAGVAYGGAGGDGASGGGGGTSMNACGFNPGGTGGDGDNGQDGASDGAGSGGPGGIGYGRSAISRYPSLNYGTFTYDVGGPGGCSGATGPWGMGGDGGSTFCGSPPDAQGGGGGGGPPLVIAARIINGVVPNLVGVYSQGGNPGNPGTCSPQNAQSGYNGNVYIFAQKMTGNSVGGFSFFVLKAFEVAKNGVTILNTYVGDLGHTWNHT